MADYQLTETDIVIYTVPEPVVYIPNDPTNLQRQEYEKWLVEGGVPDPYKPPFVVAPYDMGPSIAERLGVANGGS